MTPRIQFQKIPLSQVGSKIKSNGDPRSVILVVDDEPLVADTLVAILDKQEYSAIAAYSGEEALSIARLIKPQFLITDVMMPGMDGLDLAISIRQLHPTCRSVLFSGHIHHEVLSADSRWTQYQFPLLSKPIHPDALLAHISSLAEAVA
jgi:CheY-like chemotaxis protein